MKKKYHFIYKTTNIITNEYYVGMHSTFNINDDYMGSGYRLKRSIKKYGTENFRFEIIEWLNDRESLIKKEKEIVNEELLKDPLCLNLKPGGTGGFNNDAHKWKYILTGSKAGSKALSEMHKDPLFKEHWSSVRKEAWKNVSDENRAKIMNGLIANRGRKHTPETIEKMKQQRKGTMMGINNSQYGTKWITNGMENKKIKNTDLLPDGWKFGKK